MPDKQSFYPGINETIEFNEDFLKKVYGYSVCDESFLPAVAARLTGIGRNNVIEAYNEWFARWKVSDDKVMKNVAKWYVKECDSKFEEFQKEQQERAVEDWKQKKIALLKEKKNLLISTEN